MMNSTLLRATDITKSYAGVQALRSGSLKLRAGEVHALIGENGAGKSTLIKIITGAVEPDGGELQIGGQVITNNSPRAAKELGVAAIYQQPALFPELTVAENIALGVEQTGMAGRVDWRSPRWARASTPRPTPAPSPCRSSNSWRLLAPSVLTPKS
jgi:rhamnose transport system ATP-binding protein